MQGKIQTLDTVQSYQWGYANQKKENIKNASKKEMNNEYYLTLTNPAAPFCYLFFAFASKQAFQSPKLEPILAKMKGQTQQTNKQFENCRKNLNAHWDGVSAIPNAVRRNKTPIVKASQDLQNISSRISFQEGKELLKQGLASKKLCVDYHTNNGQYQQNIVNGEEYVNNYAAIIFDDNSRKYLLQFLSHSEKDQQHNVPQTFVDRPLPEKVQNLDNKPIQKQKIIEQKPANKQRQDKPVPTVPRQILNPDQKALNPPSLDKSLPTVPRQIFNPDQKLLPPPVDGKGRDLSGSVPSVPRQILDPNQRLLVPPANLDEKQSRKQPRKSSGQFGDKVKQAGERVKQAVRRTEQKVQQKVQHAVDAVKGRRIPWLQIAAIGVIIGVAIKAFSR